MDNVLKICLSASSGCYWKEKIVVNTTINGANYEHRGIGDTPNFYNNDPFYKKEIWSNFTKISYKESSWGKRNEQVLKAARHAAKNYSSSFKMEDIFIGYSRVGNGSSVGYSSEMVNTLVSDRVITLRIDLPEMAAGFYEIQGGSLQNSVFELFDRGKLYYLFKYGNNYNFLITVKQPASMGYNWNGIKHVFNYVNYK